ncbi:MAG TPA: ring-cleaving dioxygenase [Gemmatimonadales bacterium]|jgi:glyoxalase family protein
MSDLVRGLHHVTATVSDAQDDLDFYSGLLGQRLVKKTVNFDNTHVYHFYYGNESGTPGTIMTTFPYRNMGVRAGTRGAGQITTTSFSVPAAALDFWRARLTATHVEFNDERTPFGEDALRVRDPSGLVVRLVAGRQDQRPPWIREGISDAEAIRGIHGVTLTVREPATTIAFVRDILNGELIDERDDTSRLGIHGSAPGQLIEIAAGADAPGAINGLGTVHHVAFAVASGEDQLEIRRELVSRGVPVTEVLDRQYFQSIYFREPNGVLFEIATMPPGFVTDEPLAELGRALKLPPWEEPNRKEIAAGLPAVTLP